MRFGIPLLADRVAPRCTFADSVLVVSVRGRRVEEESLVPLRGSTWVDLEEALTDREVDTLICGGISPSTRESIRSRNVRVIENVAGTSTEILEGLRRGRIQPGFGLAREISPDLPQIRSSDDLGSAGEQSASSVTGFDCLKCRDRVCLEGKPCPHLDIQPSTEVEGVTGRILESTWDVALEEERNLCRLAELVYFALEMGYRRLGVAFCEDLREPASILTDVLRRFFEVVPVSCMARNQNDGDGDAQRAWPADVVPEGQTPCEPLSVVAALNSRSTDLNVLVGLCVGADCIVNEKSEAPVTTIFVKDKSLANNPIGAVYSHYYLDDI